MDWADTPEQAAFRQEVRTFIQTRLPPYYKAKAASERPGGLEGDWQEDIVHGDAEARAAAKEWAEVLTDRGWAAPHWPKEYGGGGMTPMEQFILNQEMAELGAPKVGGPGLALLGPTVLVHGNDEQKKKYLASTLRGDLPPAHALDSLRRRRSIWRRRCAVTSSGLRGSRSRGRVLTWRRCRRAPSRTATTT